MSDPANSDELGVVQPTVEEAAVEDVAGPSEQPVDRGRLALTELQTLTTKRCNRFMDVKLEDGEVEEIEEAVAHVRELFRKMGVNHDVSSWELDEAMPSRKRQTARLSHNMSRGRLVMKARKPKRGRNY